MKEYMIKHVGYPGGYEWIADRSILSKFIDAYINSFAKDGWRIHSWNPSRGVGSFFIFLFEREAGDDQKTD